MNLQTGARPAFDAGFAAAGTDTGHTLTENSPVSWAQTSPFNVNYNLLVDFATKALGELPQIAKQIIEDFYKQPPAYSYFEGCSGGGRQAVQIAQSFPDSYDGILAASPATDWTRMFSSIFWPQLVMEMVDYYPTQCELVAFMNASIDACDGIDGIIDRIVGNPELCHYDPHSLVGTTVQCPDNTQIEIIAKAADVVAKSWEGAVDVNGTFVWYGLSIGATPDLTSNITLYANGSRGPNPNTLPVTWFQYFVTKDPSFDYTTLNYTSFVELSLQGVREYGSIIDANDPDLSQFQKAGGKMLSWMGTIDEIIPTKGVTDYFMKAKSLQPDIENNYRLFLAPGVAHCAPKLGGTGYFPDDNAVKTLMAWVEEGVVPETVPATDRVSGLHQPLCVYPKVAKWNGINDKSLASSYQCMDHY